MYMKGYTPPASARSCRRQWENRREESFICQNPVTTKDGTQLWISNWEEEAEKA
jgi:hypothetical protein